MVPPYCVNKLNTIFSRPPIWWLSESRCPCRISRHRNYKLQKFAFRVLPLTKKQRKRRDQAANAPNLLQNLHQHVKQGRNPQVTKTRRRDLLPNQIIILLKRAKWVEVQNIALTAPIRAALLHIPQKSQSQAQSMMSTGQISQILKRDEEFRTVLLNASSEKRLEKTRREPREILEIRSTLATAIAFPLSTTSIPIQTLQGFPGAAWTSATLLVVVRRPKVGTAAVEGEHTAQTIALLQRHTVLHPHTARNGHKQVTVKAVEQTRCITMILICTTQMLGNKLRTSYFVFVLGNRRNWTDLPRLMPLYNLSHTLFWSFCFGITPLAHMELVFLGWIAILGCGWDLGRDDSKRSGKARGEGLITRGKEISLSIHRSCFTIPGALLYSATGWR